MHVYINVVLIIFNYEICNKFNKFKYNIIWIHKQ